MVRSLAVLLHPLQHLARPVDRHALFISGDKQADRAVDVPPSRLGIVESGSGETGDRPLHVGCTSTVEAAAGDLGGKRRMGPQLSVAGRYDIGVPGKAEMRRPVADARKQIVDPRRPLVVEGQALDTEAIRTWRALEDAEIDQEPEAYAHGDQRADPAERIGLVRRSCKPERLQ